MSRSQPIPPLPSSSSSTIVWFYQLSSSSLFTSSTTTAITAAPDTITTRAAVTAAAASDTLPPSRDDCGTTSEEKDEKDEEDAVAAASIVTFELEALFVDPTYVGMGVGAQLFQHAIQKAIPRMINEDTTKNEVDEHQEVTTTLTSPVPVIVLNIQSDPYAERFYLKQGCINVGQRESESIPGRFLPLLQYKLAHNK